MLNSKDIRNVKFSKSVGGYKQEEVDILLDKVEADYEQFERVTRELQGKIDALEKDISGYKTSQDSLQNVLLSAQKLADQIVDEAKAKSEQIVKNAEASIELITAREKELASAFEREAAERKANAEKELEAVVAAAEAKRAAVEKATADSVAREQLLFDRLKLEVSAFKADITRSYKEHLEILQKLPDEVPMDPKQMAEAVALAADKAPEPESFLETSEEVAEPVFEEVIEVEEPDLVQETSPDEGFVIAPVEDIISKEE